jgi:inhibitor of cysteine peptidase
MRNRAILITGAVAALVIAVGVAVAAPPDGEPTSSNATDPVHLSPAADGAIVPLGQGRVLVLDLEANPTTGFNWEIDLLDETVLTLTGEPAYVSDSDLPGSPGMMTFSFEAGDAGETELRLIYHRPWEDAAPLQTFTVIVTVG